MTASPQVLFVAWQDERSRKIVPVGRLLRISDGYEFAYIGAVDRARQLGFQPLLTFPEFESVYRSTELPPVFKNRLMSASREDFAAHVARLALRVDEAEPFTVLARSAGRRETDRLEVFAPPQIVGDNAQGLFLARGLRHIPHAEDATEQLTEQARLFVMADVQNDVNPEALGLRNEQCQLLGFVPDYLAHELARTTCPTSLLNVHVLRVNPRPAPVHHRLLCQFEYPHAKAPALFSGVDYEPLSSAATPHSASAA